jgi:DNA helicase-2/ATP-dependent DNA helicase PcrA
MRRFVLSSREEPEDRSPTTTPEADPDRVLQGLNPAQREAVESVDGPVMIIAGAGSGKTRALTHRIAYLLAAEKAYPGQILALTFTNKAAREMRNRVFDLVGTDGARGLWMGTFHSIFARLLRREGEAIGYTRDFSIYDQEDSKRLIRTIMKRYGMDTKRFKPRAMQSMISTAKNQLISPSEYEQSAYGPHQERAAQLYQPYQETLEKSNAMDFDDLLIKPIELFQQESGVLARYQKRWQYIHIDEYQDTNRAQYRLARLLADKHDNLCVVGDDAQSIYSFRGADIRNILDFQKDFPDAKTVRLERNYRSTGRILRLADSVIEHNEDQIEKKLWTENDPGEYITLLEAISEKDEARKVSQNIQDLRLRKGFSYGEFVVLYRMNAQSRSLEEALRRHDIPYQIVGGVSFYQRKEIKDALAYLKLLVNPDDTASLRRVINYPRRGIGNRTQEKITAFAQKEGISLWQAIERIEEVDALRTRQQNAVEQFRSLIGEHVSKEGSMPPDELVRSLMKETGLLEELRDENTAESLARWENVQELMNAVAEFTDTDEDSRSLGDFLQEVSLMTDVDNLEEEANQVTLMTLHGSKGLEFPVVFVTGLEEGLFPLSRATEKREELEEERRLFYVGVTRAEQQLFLSYARSRYRYGEYQDCIKSRFLDEIDTSVVRTETGQEPRSKKGRFQLDEEGKDGGGSRETRSRSRTTRTTRDSDTGGDQGRRVVYDEGEGGEIVPGIRVEHDQFGSGKVVAVDGRGNRKKATVFFKGVGQKKLMLKYAGLRVVH